MKTIDEYYDVEVINIVIINHWGKLCYKIVVTFFKILIALTNNVSHRKLRNKINETQQYSNQAQAQHNLTMKTIS